MSEIRIIQPPAKKFSWANEILGVKEKEVVKTPKQYARTIAPIISRDVKLKAPDREFETDNNSDPDYTIIKRVK